jgi:hypothetical protein
MLIFNTGQENETAVRLLLESEPHGREYFDGADSLEDMLASLKRLINDCVAAAADDGIERFVSPPNAHTLIATTPNCSLILPRFSAREPQIGGIVTLVREERQEEVGRADAQRNETRRRPGTADHGWHGRHGFERSIL